MLKNIHADASFVSPPVFLEEAITTSDGLIRFQAF